MLDTDRLILKGLVPPKNTPPAWMPMRVNRRHPLARGLVVCYLPLSISRLRNIARPGGVLVPGSASVIRPSYIGGGIFCGAANTQASVAVPTYAQITSAVTIGTSFFQEVTRSGANNLLFGVVVASDASPYFRYSLFDRGGTYSADHSVGGSYVTLSTGISVTNGVRRSFVGRFASGAQSGWVDGVSRVTGSVSGSLSYVSTDPLEFGYSVSPSNYTGANIQIGVIWDRALLDEEIRLFDREPFCFLEPDIDGVWFRGAFGTSLVPPLATWGWAGNVPAINERTEITAPTGAWAAQGNSPDFNFSTIITAAQAGWAWMGNAIPGYGTVGRGVGLVRGLARGVVRILSGGSASGR